jgi:hypothetical protein
MTRPETRTLDVSGAVLHDDCGRPRRALAAAERLGTKAVTFPATTAGSSGASSAGRAIRTPSP